MAPVDEGSWLDTPFYAFMQESKESLMLQQLFNHIPTRIFVVCGGKSSALQQPKGKPDTRCINFKLTLPEHHISSSLLRDVQVQAATETITQPPKFPQS